MDVKSSFLSGFINEEVFSTWMAFGGNTRDLGSFGEETDEITDLHKSLKKYCLQNVKIDDPNLTMEEYIRLEEEKARRRGKVYNWETATYSKIWYDEDFHNLRSVETEFPAIMFNDTLMSELTISSLNNEIDFRISFDESDDEDYTPTVSYFDDLDFFKDFENEFPAIVYNDALTSKSNFLTEPTLSPQYIDEFDLKDEISLSKCDDEEHNALYFYDLFSFNVIYPDDLKSDTNNDNDKINIEKPSGDISVILLHNVINVDVGAYAHGSTKLLKTSHDTSNKFFKTETFIKDLNVNIMACNYLNKGMSFIFLIKNFTVDTAYSLNEYNVFDTGINTAYPGDILKEIDNVSEVSTNLEFLLIKSTTRIYRANIKGVSHSNSL
ncbi:hypothetical protein Tco_1112147 [Tanacetum coccineum]|uniref:Reverse transcriptase Ty1/copia-type domain-containing protein n=1 Tax=Tanacetum coccineum TaxID=301880 RepID=A0ABQ5INL9_9ASTR